MPSYTKGCFVLIFVTVISWAVIVFLIIRMMGGLN